MSEAVNVSPVQHPVALSSFEDQTGREEFIAAFASTPSEVRRDPYRVGLPAAETWAGFLTMPFPFAREFWLVRGEGGRPLGRIGANLSTRTGCGYIGFYEVDVTHPEADKIGSRLLGAALNWLRASGATDAYGPLAFNTWFPYRFRLHGCEHDGGPTFAWEPVNPPEYVEAWSAAGFREVEGYHSQGLAGLAEFAERTRGSFEAARQKGFTFRPFDASALFEREVPLLYSLSMAGFRDNLLFETIPFEAFRRLYVPLAGKADLSLATFVMDSKGAECGFFFCFADQGYLVLKTVTMADSARGMGLSNALAHFSAINALKAGCDKHITALVRSGAQSESYAKKSKPLWRHNYALFHRAL